MDYCFVWLSVSCYYDLICGVQTSFIGPDEELSWPWHSRGRLT